MSVAPTLSIVGSLGDHAVIYAAAGLEIFPVRPDKTPYSSQYKATSDVDQVKAWWRQWPDALIGHRISPDHVVLDIDPRHGGMDVWRAIKTEFDVQRVTRWHRSGRGDGGGHTWWLRPADKLTVTKLDAWAKERGLGHNLGTRWTCGIDILHHNHRYTILPPSPHPDTGQPYSWAGQGHEQPVAPMPVLLADLITNDLPAPPPTQPRSPDPDSIADWYTTHHQWSDLLGRHGWTLRAGEGNTDGSRWRHPAATASYSATIRYGCLFVYSPNTVFEVTNPSEPHGYTLFRAYATLEHGNDLSAAAKRAREQRGPAGPTDITYLDPNTSNGHQPTETPVEHPRLPDELWEARPALQHIRQAAHSRQRSADAVLHVVLARISAITPHTVTIPPIVGTSAPLAYFAAIVAPPGVGKSSANQIAAQLLPAPEWVHDQLPLGSGEGLSETLFDLVEETGDDGKTRKVKRQVRHNGFIYADEGQTLAEIGSRNGSTLLPTIRSIWTGGALGQANASIERRRIVPAGTYVFGACIALQPTRAGALLDDVDAGTPQRFGWAAATDPSIPDTPPDWPGPLNWTPPAVIIGGSPVKLDPAIETEIRAADLERARGQTLVDPLDAHAGLYRLKVAALLAVLDGRMDIGQRDWELAGLIKTTSDAVRTSVTATVAYQIARAELVTSQRLARRHTEAQAAEERRRIVDGARKLAAKVHAEPDRWTVSELRRNPLARWRDVFNDALEHAIAEGWVIEQPEPGQGDSKRQIKPGENRP